MHLITLFLLFIICLIIITYKLAATTIITSLHVIGDSWPYRFYSLILHSFIQWSSWRKKEYELLQLLIRIFAQKFAKKLYIARGLITSFCSPFIRSPKSSSACINQSTIIAHYSICALRKSLVKGYGFIHFGALSYWRQSDLMTQQPAFLRFSSLSISSSTLTR